jgi:hypothetical protein
MHPANETSLKIRHFAYSQDAPPQLVIINAKPAESWIVTPDCLENAPPNHDRAMHQRIEPGHGASNCGIRQWNREIHQIPTSLVDYLTGRADHCDIWISIKKVDLQREAFRRARVV